MPLGGSPYFDFPGAMGDYESALMELAGSQRQAGQMDFSDFLNQLTKAIGMYTQRRQEKEQLQWQRGVTEKGLGLREQQIERQGEHYDWLERPQKPKTTLPHKAWEYWTPEQRETWKQGEATGWPGSRVQQPTAFHRDYDMTRNKIYQDLRRKEETLVGPKTPESILRQQAEQQTFDTIIGGKQIEEGVITESAIDKEYLKYVANWNKKSKTDQMLYPKKQREEYHATFLDRNPTAVTTKMAGALSLYGSREEAAADALKDFTSGEISKEKYDRIIKSINVYFGGQ